MTLDDANKLLGLAKVNYGYAFKDMTNREQMLLVQSWAVVLQDIPADIVMIAFMQLLSVSKWLPTVAEIRKKCRDLYYESYSFDYGSGESAWASAAKKYISDQTSKLRGDQPPMLPLETMLDGSAGVNIGSGEMAFLEQTKNDGRIYYLPGMEGEG